MIFTYTITSLSISRASKLQVQCLLSQGMIYSLCNRRGEVTFNPFHPTRFQKSNPSRPSGKHDIIIVTTRERFGQRAFDSVKNLKSPANRSLCLLQSVRSSFRIPLPLRETTEINEKGTQVGTSKNQVTQKLGRSLIAQRTVTFAACKQVVIECKLQLTSSVTRFGKISLLWRYVVQLWPF